MLAQTFCAERAFRIRHLDDDRLDGRDVADGRDQVVVQVLRATGDVFLQQCEADALRDAALDLALDEQRVDRAADIVRGGNLDQPDRTQLRVDLEFDELRAIAIDRVGAALSLGVERQGRRIVALISREGISARVSRQCGEVDPTHRLAFADGQHSSV